MGREGDAFRYAGHPADDVWCVNYGGREKGREGGGEGEGKYSEEVNVCTSVHVAVLLCWRYTCKLI